MERILKHLSSLQAHILAEPYICHHFQSQPCNASALLQKVGRFWHFQFTSITILLSHYNEGHLILAKLCIQM